MTQEEWREVPDAEGVFASSLGRIKSADRTGSMPNGGIRTYTGKAWFGAWTGERYIARIRGRTHKVARLVCAAFHGAPPDGKFVCIHLDEDARNNKPENLEWGTQKQNLNFPKYLARMRARERGLSQEAIHNIRQRRSAGEMLKVIATDHGIAPQTVCDIAKGKSYSDFEPESA